MSSESNYITFLNIVRINLFKFGGPILTIIGTVSCIFSVAVFMKPNLRKNPCSIYLIANSFASLFIIYSLILPQTLAQSYNIDLTLYNLGLCRFHLYSVLLGDVLGPSYLILASVDRVLFTSKNALTRQRSTLGLAYTCLTSVTIFWLLVHSHTLILGNIIPVGPGSTICYFQFGNYYRFVSYYSAIVKGILIPLTMLILGLWAVKNVRGLGRVAATRVTVANGSTAKAVLRASPSKDRQLLRILLVDIIAYLIFNLLISVALVYEQIVPTSSNNVINSQLRTFYVILGSFSSYIPSCIGFYNNLLVSKTFRHEAKDILMCK